MAKSSAVVNGVKVWFEPCEHCKATPTHEEMASAVELALEQYSLRVCGVCGGVQKIESLDLYHYKECGQDRWGSRATQLDMMFVFEERTGFFHLPVSIHPGCAAKAIPNVKWGFDSSLTQKILL